MQQEIAVNTSTLASDIETLQGQLNSIKNDMEKMYEAVRVLDNMWDGPANEAFKRQFHADQEDMKTLCETIQGIIDDMTYAKGEYNTCENEISGIISSIHI